jgi:hypothetical protein
VGFEPTVSLHPPVFKTGALNRSATHPVKDINYLPIALPRTKGELISPWTQLGPKVDSTDRREFTDRSRAHPYLPSAQGTQC